jgi:hypothetical protein
VEIPREQVINRLRAAGFTHKRQAPRVDMWKQRGSLCMVMVARRDFLDRNYVQVVLAQAGLTKQQIAEFFAAATKRES